MLDSYLDLNFEVIEKADNSRSGNGNDIKLVIIGPIALFSYFNLTTSSRKRLDDKSHAHLVSLKCNLLASSKDSDDLSIGFDGSRNRRIGELPQNKNIKGKYDLTIILKAVFGFAKFQEKATHDLGYKLTLRRNKVNTVIDKASGIADAGLIIDHIHWYIAPYSSGTQQ